MDDKQRRLIDYFSKLPEPAPPRRAPSLESIEESVESVPAVPSTTSAESVKTMLEKRLGSTLLTSDAEETFPDATALYERATWVGLPIFVKSLSTRKLDRIQHRMQTPWNSKAEVTDVE